MDTVRALSENSEDDIECTIARSSVDLEDAEIDSLVDSKTPFITTREVLQLHHNECQRCRRNEAWQLFPAIFRRKDKHIALPCPHDKEYMSASQPLAARRWRRRRCRLLASFVLVIFALFGLWNVITLIIGLGPLIWDPSLAVDHFFPNWGLPGEPGEGLTGYPTDFTRDVEPIPCHSHNDYWRRIPLYEAIHYGCTGVEADVWLFDEELFVGHTTASLTKNRTLRTMYVDPLVQILDRMNTKPQYGAVATTQRIKGVFEEAPDQTLVLLIDFKMDGREQFPVVSSHLEALRSRDYLTHYDGNKVILRPVTIVATGNAPFDLLTANTTYRDIFFDAPLDKLAESPASVLSLQHKKDTFGDSASTAGQGETGIDPTLGASQFSSENSYYASLNFKRSIGFPYRGRLTREQLEVLRTQIKAAHEKGLKARYWGTPTWPVGLRNHIWKILVEEGADYLNVDDLRSAKMVDWGRGWEERKAWIGGI